MAESIAAAFARRNAGPAWSSTSPARSTATSAPARPNGSAAGFPDSRVAVVSMLPVGDLDALAPAGDDLSAPTTWCYTVGKS